MCSQARKKDKDKIQKVRIEHTTFDIELMQGSQLREIEIRKEAKELNSDGESTTGGDSMAIMRKVSGANSPLIGEA